MDLNTQEAQGNPPSNEPIQLDDAVTMTSFGKFNYILIVISGVILSAVLLETMGISFVFPVACELNLTTTEKGLLTTIAFVGVITSSHLWGFLADTMGRRKVMIPTLFLSFVCTALSSMSTRYAVLVVFRFFSGFFISGSSAVIYAYLGEFHNKKNCARAIMGASVIFGIGCMLPPALAWLIINKEWEFYIPIIDTLYKPWRLYLVACGLPSLLASLSLLAIPESPKFVLRQGKQKEAIEILQKVYSWNTGKKRDTLIISSIEEEQSDLQYKHIKNSKNILKILKSMWKQTAPIFQAPHLSSTLIACFIQFSIYATAHGMYVWFPDIVDKVAEYTNKHPHERITVCKIIESRKMMIAMHNETEISECTGKLDVSSYEITFLLEVFYAIGFAVIGSIINAVGKLPILFVNLVLCGAFGVATIFINIPILSIYFYVILLLAAFGVPIVNAATVDLYPTQFRGMAVCIVMAMGRLGSVFGSNVYGTLIDIYCPAGFILSGGLLISCAVLSFFIPNIRNTNKKADDGDCDGDGNVVVKPTDDDFTYNTRL